MTHSYFNVFIGWHWGATSPTRSTRGTARSRATAIEINGKARAPQGTRTRVVGAERGTQQSAKQAWRSVQVSVCLLYACCIIPLLLFLIIVMLAMLCAQMRMHPILSFAPWYFPLNAPIVCIVQRRCGADCRERSVDSVPWKHRACSALQCR